MNAFVFSLFFWFVNFWMSIIKSCERTTGLRQESKQKNKAVLFPRSSCSLNAFINCGIGERRDFSNATSWSGKVVNEIPLHTSSASPNWQDDEIKYQAFATEADSSNDSSACCENDAIQKTYLMFVIEIPWNIWRKRALSAEKHEENINITLSGNSSITVHTTRSWYIKSYTRKDTVKIIQGGNQNFK